MWYAGAFTKVVMSLCFYMNVLKIVRYVFLKIKCSKLSKNIGFCQYRVIIARNKKTYLQNYFVMKFVLLPSHVLSI